MSFGKNLELVANIETKHVAMCVFEACFLLLSYKAILIELKIYHDIFFGRK